MRTVLTRWVDAFRRVSLEQWSSPGECLLLFPALGTPESIIIIIIIIIILHCVSKNVVSILSSNLVNVNRFWKFCHCWKQQWIFWKKCNIFRRLLKTSLYYRVKHKIVKMLQLLIYHSLVIKLSTPLFFILWKLKKTYYFTYLFTALSSNAFTSQEFTTLRNCWTFGMAFNRVHLTAQLMESASSRLCTGQRRTFWALTICYVSGHWNSETMFHIRRMCFSYRLTIHKVIIKVWHSCVIKNW